MGPYFQDDNITIYNTDCRSLSLPERPALVLTDPPYGKKEKTNRGQAGRGIHGPSRDFAPIAGDDKPFDPRPLLKLQTKTVLWGANYYPEHLPSSPSWIVWDKRDGTTPDDNADCELAWTNLGGPLRAFHHLWRGVCRASEVGATVLHPSQKPVALFVWCIQRAKLQPNSLIYDPYMGSGPCAVAAKLLGMRYIGVEIVEQYCQTAVTRLNDDFMPALVDTGASLEDLPMFSMEVL